MKDISNTRLKYIKKLTDKIMTSELTTGQIYKMLTTIRKISKQMIEIENDLSIRKKMIEIENDLSK